MPISVVIDTDLGNNIDDAFALSLAAVSPEVNLLGVTTTWFQSSARALIARRLLGAWERTDVPVSAGHHPRYAVAGEQSHRYFTLHQVATATDPLSPSTGQSAMDWLYNLLDHQRITYVANAPLTNLAQLLKAKPDVASKIERVVLMGGWASQALPEWNILQDPLSAAVVIRSGIPIVAIGYEVALHCILSSRDLKTLYGADPHGCRFLMDLYDLWNQATARTPPVMYDPLTVASLIDPTLFEFEERRVDVQTAEGPAYGVMYQDDVDGFLIQTAVSVDRKRYLQLLVSRLTGVAPTKHVHVRTPSAIPQVEIREGIAMSYYPGWKLSRAVSVAHTMAVVADGTGKVHVDGDEERTFSTGDLIYLGCYDTYTLETKTGMSMDLISFDAWSEDGSSHVRQRWDKRLFDLPTTFSHSSRLESVGRLLSRVVYNWRRPSLENMLDAHGLLLRLLSILVSIHAADAQASAADRQNFIQRVKEYLEGHVESEVSLDDLSQYVGMSKYHLIRLYKESEHMTPMQYYRLLKMRRARSLLELSMLSIKEISARLGYSSPAVFSRAFQAEMAMSPGQYRRMIQSH